MLTTQRLLLRQWRPDDLEPFFALNSEPEVNRHLVPLTRDRSDAMIQAAGDNFAKRGWGRWALEERESGLLIGHCGFMPLPSELAVEGEAEIGWRLSHRWQGQGLAREAAEEALRHGLDEIGFRHVVSYTTPANTASWGLMRRLGMTCVGEFGYPGLPEDHAFRRHVLYEVRR